MPISKKYIQIIFIITSGLTYGQDVNQTGISSLHQLAPLVSSGAKVSNTAVGTSAASAGNALSATSGQIGLNPQTQNAGNINSPSKERDESPTTFSKDENNIDDEKSQLQLFIAETTGKELNLYGYSLFRKSNFSPISQVPAPVNYVIGPGDEIDVKVWGSIDFNVRQIVDRDGRITLPQLGSFGIAGIKVEDLDETLKKQIGRLFKGFEVSGTLSKIRSIQIYVVGNARKPGAYTVSGMSTLISALFEASGPSHYGTMRKIRLIRDGKQISQVDLYDFIKNGDSSGNVKLLSGDVIQIPAVGPRVGLLGAIDGQAIYELEDNDENLGDLLSFIGGTNTLVSSRKIFIERINNSDSKTNRSVEEKSLDNEGRKFVLKDGDLITFRKINHQYANAVIIKGIETNDIKFEFKEGMKISDLIPESELLIHSEYFSNKNIKNMREDLVSRVMDKDKQNAGTRLNEINWNYAVIERLDRKEVKLNIIPFNLGKAVKEKDPTHDLKLQAGDVVIVYSDKDIQIPQSRKNIFVKVSGEINAPGMYQITQSDKLIDLVNQAGGLTKDAYLYGANFTRMGVKKVQQENLNMLVNRLETEINSQTLSSAQNTINQESLLSNQQQLVTQRTFLNKLKTTQASGRISLEMNPETPALPDLILEDGDEVFIPNKPSFIGVFGAVYKESTFIFKSDATVKDYLFRAGLTRESDTNAVMVIRADASIDSDAKNTGFFSKRVMDMKLFPGDVIFVPETFDKRTAYTQFMTGAKDWTTILYQFGIGAAAWNTLKN